jgi:hypothetical protein
MDERPKHSDMKRPGMFSIRTFVFVSFVLTLVVAMGWASAGAVREPPLQNRPVAPTLARLSFWVPPQRMTEFEAAYEARVVPILKRHGLVPSSERGRATPDNVFSRLFEMKMPLEVEEKQKALQGDSTWKEALRGLESAFRTAGSDTLRYDFRLYAAPAGPGKMVTAGPGKVVPAGRGQGHWRTYDMADGLVGAGVLSIFQDREGYLWFGTYGGGVSRYDGKAFQTLTRWDGLAHNVVERIFQDRDGYLWFGTNDGVTRYRPPVPSPPPAFVGDDLRFGHLDLRSATDSK